MSNEKAGIAGEEAVRSILRKLNGTLVIGLA